MFFPDRIKNIKPGDKVLEIGPGAHPFHRSDVLLEKKFENEKEYQEQFGHTGKLVTDKKVVFYEGDIFPFKDKEFDYVICSHVLEHVENVPEFLDEVFRVSSKGYFEYPLIYYEYLYNFEVHLNYLKHDGKTMKYMKKKDSGLSEFRPVQKFFYDSLNKGHVSIINDLLTHMMEGFEWNGPFSYQQAKNLAEVCHSGYEIKTPEEKVKVVEVEHTTKELIKKLIRKVI